MGFHRIPSPDIPERKVVQLRYSSRNLVILYRSKGKEEERVHDTKSYHIDNKQEVSIESRMWCFNENVF